MAQEVAPPSGPDFAEEFAEFACGVSLDTLPKVVVDAVKADIFDTLACANAGINAAGVDKVIDKLLDWGGKPEARIWCTGARVPVHHAAWANGMMAHARDFDDSLDTATLHAGVAVVPAAIVAAELNPKATGADLIAGVAVGLELISRLGLATKLSCVQSGYIYTSLLGGFAATAAAARVLGFDKDQMINALGLAYSQAAGNHQVTLDLALAKRIQPGLAAKSALVAVTMTQMGITGARRSFEGQDGFFRTYLHSAYEPSRLRLGLGSVWDLLQISFKAYPCCRFGHAAIDAGLALRAKVAPEKIRKITIFTNHLSWSVCGQPEAIKQAPRTTIDAQFSIPFGVACAVVNGNVGLTDLTDAGIRQPAVLDLAARVFTKIDPVIDQSFQRSMSPARLVAEIEGGTIEIEIAAPLGSTENPMQPQHFETKMAGCLAISGLAWPQDQTERYRHVIQDLDSFADVSPLIALLAAPGA